MIPIETLSVKPTHKTCSDCGSTFTCGMGEEIKTCWCNDLPPIMPLDSAQDCRCPECLKKAVKEKVNEFVKTITPENALNSIPEKYKTSNKLTEGIDYTIENNFWIFSKWYLLKRGYCCENNCRNCPYKTK